MQLWWLTLLAASAAAYDFGYLKYLSKEDSSEEDGGQKTGSRTTSCPCGWTNKGRIVNGKETLPNEYPLQVAIMERKYDEDTGEPAGTMIRCGGSIITQSHVLSAAHCTHFVKETSDLYIVAGGHNIKSAVGDKSVQVEIEKWIEHEKYDYLTLEYDIALIVLAKPLRYTQYIGPVCMPSASHSQPSTYIKALGWGLLKNHKATSSKPPPVSDVLMKVNLRVTDLEDCAENFPLQPIDLDDRRQICTFRRDKDSCRGDSGGPLIWLDPDTNRYTQVALVSYGRSCAKTVPAVNTDVFYYMDWIKKTIAGSGRSGTMCHKV